jgi:MFS family permease
MSSTKLLADAFTRWRRFIPHPSAVIVNGTADGVEGGVRVALIARDMSPEARRAVLVVYALVFYTAALEVAIIPLLPLYSREFDLSTVEVGVLLASVNVAVMVLSIPLGRLSDTIGARRMTVAAAIIYALAAVGQGLSSVYELLVLSWAAFGVGVAIVASGSLAWLSDSLPDDKRASALGGVATISGVGIIVGPLFGGIVIESLDRATAFLFAAAVVGLLAVLAYRSTSEATGRPPLISLSTTLLAVRTEPLVGGGLALVGLLGLVFGVVSVLVPLRLAENGLSEGEIGLVFSATAAIFIAVSWAVARGGARHVTLQMAAALGFAQAAALLIPIASISTLALVAFLVIRAPIWGTSSTIAYPLTSEGAHRAGLGRGAIFGLLNLGWGVAAVAGPLFGSTIAHTLGERWAFGALALFCVGIGLLLLALTRREALLARTNRLVDAVAPDRPS